MQRLCRDRGSGPHSGARVSVLRMRLTHDGEEAGLSNRLHSVQALADASDPPPRNVSM